MPDLEDQLKDILNEELSVYRQLLVLAERKKKVLLEKFSTDLIEIVTQEETLIATLAQFEETRRDIVSRLQGNPDLGLEELLPTLPPGPAREAVAAVGRDLKGVLGQIREINEGNQKLLEQALELTQYSLKLITRPPKDIVYRKPGTQTGTQLPNRPSILVDRKA